MNKTVKRSEQIFIKDSAQVTNKIWENTQYM